MHVSLSRTIGEKYVAHILYSVFLVCSICPKQTHLSIPPRAAHLGSTFHVSIVYLSCRLESLSLFLSELALQD